MVKTLIENLKHPNVEIQIEASKAFRALTNAYYHTEGADKMLDNKNVAAEI